MADASREPLMRYIATQQVTDAEMRVLLRSSAVEARRLMANASPTRRAQIELARGVQRRLWVAVGSQTRVAVGDGVDAAAESHSFLSRQRLGRYGIEEAWYRNSLLASARSGIDNLVSRQENGISLSERVYRSRVISSGQMDRMLNGLIVNGASAQEIASRVHGFIDPNTPGGASYAAMRLARTELNNAFHRTQMRLIEDDPMVVAVKWNLSGSHPKPDACNEYAEQSHMRGGDPGVFAKGDVPMKPHPNCLCYLTPVEEDEEAFLNNWENGSYDGYLASQSCTRR